MAKRIFSFKPTEIEDLEAAVHIALNELTHSNPLYDRLHELLRRFQDGAVADGDDA